jgi:hypothetical protein
VSSVGRFATFFVAVFTVGAMAQEPSSTDKLVETVRELIRVEIISNKLAWNQQRLHRLEEKRSVYASTIRRIDEESAPYDREEFERTHPQAAAQERENERRREAELSEAKRQLASVDRDIDLLFAETQRLLLQLGEIERRLEIPSRKAAEPPSQ